MRGLLAPALCLGIAVSTLPGSARAQGAVPDARADAAQAQTLETARRAHALSSEVMSPYCPGRTLTDCPSPDAAALRGEIRRLLASGVGEEAIRLELERRYGDVVLGVPRSVWGWLLPVLLLCAGAVVLAFALARVSRSRRESSGRGSPRVSDELASELDAELESRGL